MSWELRRVPWTPQEDERLRRFVARYGTNCWSTAPDRAQLLRDARSRRERWHFYLSPDRKCGPITAQEEELIIRLHSIYGDWWWKIAWGLPGRTPKQIKNHWRTHLSQRFVAPQGIDPRTTHGPIMVEAGSSEKSTVTPDGDGGWEMVPLPPVQPSPSSAAGPGAGDDNNGDTKQTV